MTAVSLVHAGLTDFGDSMKMAGGTMSIFSLVDQLQSLSKENLDQVRNTMMRHEELFKEQVQALHKLYNVQKSAMQEVRKMIRCSAQTLASSSNNKDARCDQLNDFVVERKPFNENHTDESCVLPMNSLSAVQECTGSSLEISFGLDFKEVNVSPNACNKQRKKIDLERPPEEYMDESDYQIESNNFDILGANSRLSEENRITAKDSLMRCNQVVLHMDFLSSKKRDRRPDFITPSEPSQESWWDCSRFSESKIHTAFTKCTTGIQSLQDSFNHNIIQDFPWDHLPAVGVSTTNPSLDSQVKKPSWLLQWDAPLGSQRSNCASKSGFFESEELNLERKDPDKVNNKLASNSDLTDSTQLHPAFESNSKIIVPHLELEKQLQHDLDQCLSSYGSSLPRNSTTCPQLSSNHHIHGVSFSDTNPLPRNLNSCSWALTCQTGDDNGNEDPNCSGHGSSSPVYQDENNFRDKVLGAVSVNNAKCSSDCELVQTGDVKVEVTKLELKEALQSSDEDVKASPSIPGSDGKQQYAAELKCAVNCTETERSREEPVIAKESNEEDKSESTLEEACESIAAKILLSFAPCKSQSDSKRQFCETQIDVESSRSSRESMGHVKKQNRCTRRSLNYRNGVGMDEAVKWTKPVCERRRSSRIQR